MLTPTHLVAGQTTFLLASVIAGHQPTLSESFLAAAASVIPDLDSKQSYIGRMVLFASGPLESYFGHRTVTHSLVMQVFAGFLAYTVLPYGYFLAIMAGWLSHSMADMMTPAGVCWFWPSRVRCVIPGNARYRMDSMGKGELWFVLIMAVSAIPLLALAQTGKGTTGLIRSAIGNISTAREDYDAQKGSHVWSLDVEGRNNRTYEDAAGTYPVIGPYGESGFIVETPEGPRAICRSSSCDLYSEHAGLLKGDPQQTTTSSVQVKRITADSLFDSFAPLLTSGNVFLLGELTATGVTAIPPTVEVTSKNIRLSYASPEVLRKWGKILLEDVALTIQVRHAPGTQVGKMEVIAPVAGMALNPLLQKWVDASQQ